MSGLTNNDLKVLAYYAEHGMRERYWNYLANPTNERAADNGYGLLAMGVVRNDNMSGAIANNYAQNHVAEHPINGKRHLTEQQWEKVGVDLIKEDYAIRARLVQKGQPEQALNLPVNQVYAAHIAAFEKNNISPNAWTPAVLINASYERTGNFNESNQIWQEMLDSQYVGLSRLGNTLSNQWNNSRLFDGYTANQTKATIEAAMDLPYNDPNKIGDKYNFYHKVNGQWHHDMQSPIHGELNPISQSTVTDPKKIQELNGISELREERIEKSRREHKHPNDPNDGITPSRHTIVDNNRYEQESQFAVNQNVPMFDSQSKQANNSQRERFEQLFSAVMSDDTATARRIQTGIMNSDVGQQFIAQAKATVVEQDRQSQELQAQLALQAEINLPAQRGPLIRV